MPAAVPDTLPPTVTTPSARVATQARPRLPISLSDLDVSMPEGSVAEAPPLQTLDADRLTHAWDALLAWLESAYPSLQPIFLRRRWRVEGPRLVVATASELEAELIATNREPLQQQLATLLGTHATAVATQVQPELAPAPIEQPLTLDERRRRLEVQNPHFVLFQQIFQTFYDP